MGAYLLSNYNIPKHTIAMWIMIHEGIAAQSIVFNGKLIIIAVPQGVLKHYL